MAEIQEYRELFLELEENLRRKSRDLKERFDGEFDSDYDSALGTVQELMSVFQKLKTLEGLKEPFMSVLDSHAGLMEQKRVVMEAIERMAPLYSAYREGINRLHELGIFKLEEMLREHLGEEEFILILDDEPDPVVERIRRMLPSYFGMEEEPAAEGAAAETERESVPSMEGGMDRDGVAVMQTEGGDPRVPGDDDGAAGAAPSRGGGSDDVPSGVWRIDEEAGEEELSDLLGGGRSEPAAVEEVVLGESDGDDSEGGEPGSSGYVEEQLGGAEAEAAAEGEGTGSEGASPQPQEQGAPHSAQDVLKALLAADDEDEEEEDLDLLLRGAGEETGGSEGADAGGGVGVETAGTREGEVSGPTPNAGEDSEGESSGTDAASMEAPADASSAERKDKALIDNVLAAFDDDDEEEEDLLLSMLGKGKESESSSDAGTEETGRTPAGDAGETDEMSEIKERLKNI